MVACRIRAHAAEMGYVLARKHWNRRHMTDAVRAVIEWVVSLEPVFRMWAVCDTANMTFAQVLEKAGMSRESTESVDSASERVLRHSGAADEGSSACLSAHIRCSHG